MKDGSPLGSVDKALRALTLLGAAGGRGLSLSKLSAELSINKASLHRTLAALHYRGFVEREDDTQAYCLGPTVLVLADAYLQDGSLRALLHPSLTALSVKVGELCHLGTLHGDEIVYVDKVEPQRAIRVWSEIGRQNPALTTALGRAILSQKFDSFEAFVTHFPNAVPVRTRYTLTSPKLLWKELAAARTRGFAKEEQENELGISCIAVAVMRRGLPIAAVSISALSDHMHEARMVELATTIRATLEHQLPPGLSLQGRS